MNKKLLTNILSTLVFILLAVLASYFMPRRKSNFAYYFEKGKPWNYSLVTAQQDFPIYKTEKELEEEKAEILKKYTPFFTINTDIKDTILNTLVTSKSYSKLSKKQTEKLENILSDIYHRGVISSNDMENMLNMDIKYIEIIDNHHIAHKILLQDLYTPKTAYSTIVKNLNLESTNKHLDSNTYIKPNLTYDSIRSEKLYSDLVSSVSLTSGMVQQGERIIDRGEIVTEYIYQLLISLRAAADEREIDAKQSILSYSGLVCLSILLVSMLVIYLYIFKKHLTEKLSDVIFICLIMAVLLVVTALVIRFSVFSIYIVPFALLPIMLRVFYDSYTAFFCHLVLVLIVALMQPSSFTFIMVQVMVGLVTVVSLKDVSLRSQLLATAAFVFLIQSLVYTACYIGALGTFEGLNWQIYVCFIASSLLLLLVYGLIYIAERVFGFTSALTLVELTNVNSGLLLEFAHRTPGTFQHALQVSNLATEAAKRINANVLLVRVGALYHDIGKMVNPHLFTENQSDGVNPLNNMTEIDAAKLIISHVTEGIKIAKKKHLPSIITTFIETHHGTSKVRYFYNKYVNNHPDENIDENLFCYKGPKPYTKEMGILMMADAVEARSRSLTNITEQSISQMVEQMIGLQISEGELSQTPLSLKDVEDIKHVFVENLVTMYHHRITYPELKR